MKHIFLTGAIQVGKSTVIDRVLSRYSGRLGGFRTGYGPDRALPNRSLYLWSAAGAPCYDETHAVTHIRDSAAHPLPARFDDLGTACLAGTAELWILDECGRLEREALAFQRAILEKLEGETPVLGVVRQGFPGWTAAIAAHPAVELLTVTPENRDALPALLLARLGREISRNEKGSPSALAR